MARTKNRIIASLLSVSLCTALLLTGCGTTDTEGSISADSVNSAADIASPKEETALQDMVFYSKEKNDDLSYIRKVEGDNPYDNDYDFEEHGDFREYAVKIEDVSELNEVLKGRLDKYDCYGKDLEKTETDISRYNDDYFQEKSLLVFSIYSGLNPVDLETMEKEEDGSIKAEIYEERGESEQADRIVLIFAEVEKGYFDDNTKVEVCINTRSMKDEDGGIPFQECCQGTWFQSNPPQISGLQVIEDRPPYANVIIDNYEDYKQAAEILKADSGNTGGIKIPEKDEAFFENKAVLFHFNLEGHSNEYAKHTVKRVDVIEDTIEMDIDLTTHPGVGSDSQIVWYMLAIEVDQDDIEGVQSFQANRKEVIGSSM